MKRLVALTCLVAALAAPRVLAQPNLERVPLFGRDYVRVQDWAAANHFQSHWLERQKVLELTNRTERLVLTVNSVEAGINGVKVWFTHPVALQANIPYISHLDVQTTVQPLMQPAKNSGGSKIKLIALDPGHGGKDTGNVVGFQAEKKYTLLLAFEVRDLLKKSGLKVALTRSTDTFVELPDRPAIAKKLGADLFVSLHFNSSDEDKNNVEGAEIYCLTPAGASSTNARGEGADSPWTVGNRNNDKNLLLAWQIQHSLIHNLDVEDRGVRRARFAVLRDTVMPAVLIEGGFMSHPAEGKKIFSATYRHEMAKAIVNGILAYKRAVEPAPAQ